MKIYGIKSNEKKTCVNGNENLNIFINYRFNHFTGRINK